MIKPEKALEATNWEEYFEKTRYYPAQCFNCGWTGSSAELDDSYGDVYCPRCGVYYIVECEISELPLYDEEADPLWPIIPLVVLAGIIIYLLLFRS